MQVSRLKPGHATEYRALMLGAYASAPEAFTATVPERSSLPLSWWAARLGEGPKSGVLVLGAFVADRLVGVAGLRFFRRERTRHKAMLFGMFVRPECTRRGIARTLVEAALERARSTPGVRLVQLTVTESNTPAIQLYESCGFRSYGLEPLAIRVGERFVAKLHMWCPLDGER